MGRSFVIDTNIAIAQLEARVIDPLPKGVYAMSIIGEIEILVYPGVTPEYERDVHQFLNQIQIIGISGAVKEEAVRIRRTFRLKLPDAIIAATSVVLGATLLSNDRDFGRLTGISVVSLPVLGP
jgi:predicted nucleic acid-binding protein